VQRRFATGQMRSFKIADPKLQNLPSSRQQWSPANGSDCDCMPYRGLMQRRWRKLALLGFPMLNGRVLNESRTLSSELDFPEDSIALLKGTVRMAIQR
jgi:hypothetical protein